jgi:hypothetical protein
MSFFGQPGYVNPRKSDRLQAQQQQLYEAQQQQLQQQQYQQQQLQQQQQMYQQQQEQQRQMYQQQNPSSFFGSNEQFHRAAAGVAQSPQLINSLADLWNYMQQTYGYSNQKLQDLVTAFSISSSVNSININQLNQLLQPDLETTNATPARDILFSSEEGQKKQAIRNYLEHWDPDKQCKKFSSDYFETTIRKQIEQAMENELLQNSEVYRNYINYNTYRGITNITPYSPQFSSLVNDINIDIFNLVKSRSGVSANNTIKGLEVPTQGYGIMEIYPMEQYYTNNFDVSNQQFPCFGLYDRPKPEKISGTNFNINSGKCWICQNYIPFFVGFLSLTKDPSKTRIVCTNLGECEHVIAVFDAAKMKILTDTTVPGSKSEYYPSHTHCNQVKSDYKFWWKNFGQINNQTGEAHATAQANTKAIKQYITKLVSGKINQNERNASMLKMLTTSDFGKTSDKSMWVNYIAQVVQTTLDDATRDSKVTQALFTSVDPQTEAFSALLNLLNYLEPKTLTLQNMPRFGGGYGGGDEKETMRNLITNKKISYLNILCSNFEIDVKNFKEELTHSFNKIYIEKLKTENKQLFLVVNNNIEDIKLQEKFDFLINNITSYSNNNPLINAFINKYLIHLNEINVQDYFLNETPQIIKLSKGEINSFDEITDCMEITLLENLLNISKDLLNNIFIIIGNQYVYISDIENSRKVIEDNFIIIENNNFTYLGAEYNIEDIVIKNMNLNNKIAIKYVINETETKKETYQLDNLLKMNETLKNIAMLDNKSDTDPQQLEVVAQCIENISENNPEFAENLDGGIRDWLTDFNIVMPTTKISSIDRLKTLRSDSSQNIPKITTLKPEQINNFLNEDNDIKNMCQPDSINLQQSGQICDGKDGSPIYIKNPQLKNIILKDMCKGYNNYQYNEKKNIINCFNNSIGGKTKKKRPKQKNNKKKFKTTRRKIIKRKITKRKITKRKTQKKRGKSFKKK